MLVLVIVLVVTNLLTLGALAYLYLQPIELPGPDPAVADALDRTPVPTPLVGSGTRRMISVEILNPIELAGTRGRLAGIAGSLVPGLTRRIVYDQTLKILKQQLVDQKVVADVRLHTLRPVAPAAPETPPRAPRRTSGRRPEPQPVEYADEVEKVDLDKIETPEPEQDAVPPPAGPPERPAP